MAVSILLARALVDAVGETGVDRGRFLERAAFDPVRMDHSDGRMSIEEYDRLVECALELTADEALGLHISGRTQGAANQVMASLVASSDTLRDGLDTLFRFHRLVTDRAAWRLEEQGCDARLVYDVAPGPPRCRRFRAEVTMAGFFQMVHVFRRDARLHLAAFEHPAPAYRSEYTRTFGDVERFDESFTGLVFDRQLLSARQLNSDPELYQAIEVEAKARTSRLDRRTSYADRVRDYLLHGATSPGYEFDMEDVARGLGLSMRTLRRRLQEEGATYGAVASTALAALAKRLLVDEARSVKETAYAMGFSTVSSFHKAFKRWTGMTPAAFRQRDDRAAVE